MAYSIKNVERRIHIKGTKIIYLLGYITGGAEQFFDSYKEIILTKKKAERRFAELGTLKSA